MDTVLNTFIAGLAYIIAGLCGLTRHFLLEPKYEAIPKAPAWLLHVFFFFSAVLLFVGTKFMWAWANGTATHAPPGATGMGVITAVAMLLYKSALLKDTINQFKVAGQVWRR